MTAATAPPTPAEPEPAGQTFAYREILPPTNVTHALALHWTRAGRAATRSPPAPGAPPPPPTSFPPDLVVIAGSELSVFTVRVPGDAHGDAHLRGPAWPGPSDLDAARLERVAGLSLAGVPTGAAVLRGRGPAGWNGGGDDGGGGHGAHRHAARDALLLSFRDAKAVVLDWDAATASPVPTSLHSFEGPEGGGGGGGKEGGDGGGAPADRLGVDPSGGRAAWARPPAAAADPDGRLAAVAYFGSAVALLPAVDADALDAILLGGGGGGGGGGGKPGTAPPPPPASPAAAPAAPTPVGNARFLDLSAPAHGGVVDLIDVAFAHRAATPLLLVLHAAGAAWPGTARGAAGAGGGGGAAGGRGGGAARAAGGGPDAAAVVALALDPAGRVPPTPLWTVHGLPSDARALAPAPGGGVLVVCHRLLVWIPPGGGGSAGPGPAAALSRRALPGPPPPRLELDPLREVPSLTAARHARRWAHVLHPEAAPAAAAGAAPPPPGVDADACGAAVAWLSPSVALLALANGQLLTLTAVGAGGSGAGAVTRLELAAAGVASPAARGGLTPAGPGLAFLGGWGGDSLLLRAEVVGGGGGAADAGRGRRGRGGAAPPPPLLTAGPASGGGGPDAMDVDAAAGALVLAGPPPASPAAAAASSDKKQAGGSGGDTAPPAPAVALRVLDTLPCAGPMRCVVPAPADAAVLSASGSGGGAAAAAAAAATAGAPGFLAAATGVGRAGAVTLLRRAVVPEVITAVPLPGLAGAWTLSLSDRDDGGGGGAGGAAGPPPPGSAPGAPLGYHTVMLLTVGPATRALRTGAGLEELPSGAGWEAAAPTLTAGTLAGGAFAVQVTPRAVILVGAGERGRVATLDRPGGILAGCVLGALSDGWSGGGGGGEGGAAADPAAAASLTAAGALALRTPGGGAEVLALDPLAGALVPLDIPGLRAGGGRASVTALALFRDGRRWWSGPAAAAAAAATTAPPAAPLPGPALAAAARADGRLDVFRLDDGLHLASYGGLADGSVALTGGRLADGGGSSGGSGGRGGRALGRDARDVPATSDGSPPPITDLLLEAFPEPAGDAGAVVHEAPLLFAAAADGGVFVYRAALADEGGGGDCGGGGGGPSHPSHPHPHYHPPSFVRLDVPGLTAAATPAWPPPGTPGGPAWSASARDPARPAPPRLTRFDCLGEAPPRHSGVFVSGDAPAWVVAARGGVAAHPAWPGGPGAPPVLGFAPFHNANCGHGFVLAAGPPTEPVPPLPAAAAARGGGGAPPPGPAAAAAAAAAAAGGVLRVCAMPASTRLDGPWPAARLPLRAEPAALAWHGPGRLWAVALSRARLPGASASAGDPGRPYQEPGGDPAAAYAYAAAGGPHGAPGEEGSTPGVTAASAAAAAAAPAIPGAPPPAPPPPPLDEVRLLSADGLETLWRAHLAPGEAASALASVSLREGGPAPPPARPGGPPGRGAPPPPPPLPAPPGVTVELIAVGTAITACGEDFPSTGRVLLIEVRRAGEAPAGGGAAGVAGRGLAPLRVTGAAAAAGGAAPGWEAEIIYSRELRGPVTSVAAMDGALIVSYGSRVEGLAWSGGRLGRTAFHDGPWFAGSAAVVKNFVVAGDALSGVRFLHAINGVRNFIELAKEWDAQAATAVGTAVAGRKLCLVSADAGGALRALSYDAAHPDSWRGKRLVPLGAVHTGSVGTAIVGVRAKAGGGGRAGLPGAPPPPRVQAALVARVDGGLSALLPLVDPAAVAALSNLETAAWTGLPHAAGLNPAAWRARHVARTPAALGGGSRWGGGVPPPPRGVLDGDLLARAVRAPRPVLARLAASAGVEGGAPAAAAAVGAGLVGAVEGGL